MRKINWTKAWPLIIAVLFTTNGFLAAVGWHHLNETQWDAANKFLSAIGALVSGLLTDLTSITNKEDPN